MVLLRKFDAASSSEETLNQGERAALAIFSIPVAIGCWYSTHRLWNLFRLLTSRHSANRPPGLVRPGEEPAVTIQICCYNEVDVIAETIDAACSIDWPKDKLCVDVLDDSTDETSAIVASVCAEWRRRGIQAQRRTRPNRLGYKAGNLHYHHEHTLRTEFVAFFDADHRAHPEFLRRTVPYFYDVTGAQAYHVALVQCPWGYYNREANVLTRCDALNLDAAFVVEQTVRSSIFGFVAFNGTGGIWRKTAIDAGGGWHWDTITEDLDLSYRVYIVGYEFCFVPDLVQLLEVPANMAGFNSQKHRWTKGFSQVARKSLGYILQTPLISSAVKFEAFMHVTTNIQYLVALWLILWMPLLAYMNLVVTLVLVLSLFPAVVWGLVATAGVFLKHPQNIHDDSFAQRLRRLVYLVPSCALALGRTVPESCAFLEGFFSADATFVRTPKDGMASSPPKESQKAAGLTAARKGLFLSSASRPATFPGTGFDRTFDTFSERIATRLRVLASCLSAPDTVLLLETCVTIYLFIASYALIARALQTGKSMDKLVHVPVTLVSLAGFLWVTIGTARTHLQKTTTRILAAGRRSTRTTCRLPCICSGKYKVDVVVPRDQDEESAVKPLFIDRD